MDEQEIDKILFFRNQRPLLNISRLFYSRYSNEKAKVKAKVKADKIEEYFKKVERIDIHSLFRNIRALKNDETAASRSKKVINTVLSHWLFEDYWPPDIKSQYVYRSINMNFNLGDVLKGHHGPDKKIKISSDQTPYVPYASTTAGVREYLRHSEDIDHWTYSEPHQRSFFIIRKKLRKNGFLLNFEQLHNDINPNNWWNTSEYEVWMKQIPYYNHATINEMFYYDAKADKLHHR